MNVLLTVELMVLLMDWVVLALPKAVVSATMALPRALEVSAAWVCREPVMAACML